MSAIEWSFNVFKPAMGSNVNRKAEAMRRVRRATRGGPGPLLDIPEQGADEYQVVVGAGTGFEPVTFRL